MNSSGQMHQHHAGLRPRHASWEQVKHIRSIFVPVDKHYVLLKDVLRDVSPSTPKVFQVGCVF